MRALKWPQLRFERLPWVAAFRNKCWVSGFVQGRVDRGLVQLELGWLKLLALSMIPLTQHYLSTICVLMNVAEIFSVWRERGELASWVGAGAQCLSGVTARSMQCLQCLVWSISISTVYHPIITDKSNAETAQAVVRSVLMYPMIWVIIQTFIRL